MKHLLALLILLLSTESIRAEAIDDLLQFFYNYATTPAVEESGEDAPWQPWHSGIAVQVVSGQLVATLDAANVNSAFDGVQWKIASGQTVGLVDGTVVALATGSTVALSPGTEVTAHLATGTKVGISDGAKIKVEKGDAPLDVNVVSPNPLPVAFPDNTVIDVNIKSPTPLPVTLTGGTGTVQQVSIQQGSDCLRVTMCDKESSDSAEQSWEGEEWDEEELTSDTGMGKFDDNSVGFATQVQYVVGEFINKIQELEEPFPMPSIGTVTSYSVPISLPNLSSNMVINTSGTGFTIARSVLLFFLTIMWLQSVRGEIRKAIA